jgi:tetratricopeptide (TPR) repeat protein/transcriptional regulator with XRE-family HTH domain
LAVGELPPSTLGAIVRRHRRAAGITQQELARMAGVSIRALRDIEQDRVQRPQEKTLQRLAAALGRPETAVRGVLAPPDPAAKRPPVQVSVLGSLVVRRDGLAVDLTSKMQRGLLGLLALHPHETVSQEEIVDVLWGDHPPRTCTSLVHIYVGELRAMLEPDRQPRARAQLLRLARGGYRLDLDNKWLDLAHFDDLAGRAGQAQAAGDLTAACDLYRRALQCWRGPVLAGERARVRQHPAALAASRRRMGAAVAYADLAMGLEHHDQAAGQLLPLLDDDPLHEGLFARLMLALAGCGEQAQALRLYSDLRARLREELGIDPGIELQEAHRAVLLQEHRAAAMARSVAVPEDEVAGPGTDPPAAIVVGRASTRPVPAQLPADVAGFAGRTWHVKKLDALLAGTTGRRPRAVGLVAITGTAGVGKTALSVRWAHRVRDRFPDGQLYINLNGYAATAPIRPVEALARFLDALGVPPEQIPVDTEQAAALYRSLLADTRTLIVLDNASRPDQVRPLLPGGSGCLVLVTSRDRLSGLAARDGAYRLALDVLTAQEAQALLARTLGAGRVRDEAAAAAELARCCAHLPLALRIIAAHLTDRPERSIGDEVAELHRDDRLNALQVDGDPQSTVRATFDFSYTTLAQDERRLFRLLGLAPGPDITRPAAAAMAGVAVDRAGRLLERLAAAHLISQPAPGRYALHDLLRLYAREHAQQADTPADRATALNRLLGWYLYTADAAARLLYPHILRLDVPPAPAGPPHGFADNAGALAWLTAERSNLAAAVRHAARHGPHPTGWLVADTLWGYFWQSRYTIEWLEIAEAGLAAAVEDGNLPAQVALRRSLGLAHYCLYRYPSAIEHLNIGAELAERAGWVDGQAAIAGTLGMVYKNMGDLRQAADCHTESLTLNRRTGRRAGQAVALGNLCLVYRRMGELARAADCQTEALALYQLLGSRDGEAIALENLGDVEHALGRLDQAHTHLTQALDLQRQVGNRYAEAETLHDLAAVHHDAGRHAEALDTVQAALTLARDVGERRVEGNVLNLLGAIHRALGRPGQAMDHHQQALRMVGETGTEHTKIEALIGMAAAERDAGRYADAVRYAGQAVGLASQAGYRVLEGQGLAALASVHLAQGDGRQAVDCAERALAIHHRTGHRLGEARTRLILGHALRQAQQPDAARTQWRQALALFASIGTQEASQVSRLLGKDDPAPSTAPRRPASVA